jgi:hypothetical protein
MIPDVRRFMIPDLRRFLTPDLRKFMIQVLRGFMTLDVRKFMIQVFRRFMIFLKLTVDSREELSHITPKNLSHKLCQTRRFVGVRFSTKFPNSSVPEFVALSLHNVEIFNLKTILVTLL